MKDIILASASGIRLKILKDFGFNVRVVPASIDEDEIKNSMLNERFASFLLSLSSTSLGSLMICLMFNIGIEFTEKGIFLLY
mgnify:CR=1 FL=1